MVVYTIILKGPGRLVGLGPGYNSEVLPVVKIGPRPGAAREKPGVGRGGGGAKCSIPLRPACAYIQNPSPDNEDGRFSGERARTRRTAEDGPSAVDSEALRLESQSRGKTRLAGGAVRASSGREHVLLALGQPKVMVP